MSNPAQVGGYEWKATLKKAQAANDDARATLKKILRESGSPLVQALAGQLALCLMDGDSALDRLEEIGKNTEKRRGSSS